MTTTATELHITAPAKINLGLEILRRRADGFHDINTVFAAVDLRDDLHLRSRSDGRITCAVVGNERLEADGRNLCVRAAMALRDAVGDQQLGLDIELKKNIPIGAGLGGGSSDAASVLCGAAALWNLSVDDGTMQSLALVLGSDVPFFLHGGLAVATSRGERLTPLDLHLPFSLLLVNPGIHVSTPWAYQAVNRIGERAASDLSGILLTGIADPAVMRSQLVNDFEPAVFAAHPRLREIQEALYEAGALYAAMSGSGSTMLGLFASDDAAGNADRHFAGEWTVVTRFLE
jgi:4-diphosphocytidyl-2-C-methyl-D-erythritol kinase